MRRRTVLTALGASVVPLTGCAGQGSPKNDSADTGTPGSETEPPTPTPRNGPREVRISSVDDVPDDPPLDPSVEVLRSSVTADRTARIRITLTNTSDRTVWNNSRIRAFSSFITDEGPQNQQLALLRPEENNSTVRSDCYRSALTERALKWYYTDVVSNTGYDPDETKATTFDIYGHPGNTGPCLALGDYPIRSEYRIAEDAEAEETNWEFEWGFTITVEEPV